ncbi:MAG: DEAD/DEAH box helicase family protein [Nitrospira sp.]|nr:DEAD/DEAH box helicase family protein [Nitrospira sp.]
MKPAEQIGLFDRPPERDLLDDFDFEPEPVPESRSAGPLRYYQGEATDGIFASLEINRSALIVCATGTGKTRIGSEVAARWTNGRVLWLAHREELCHQAREALELRTGESVGFEKAGITSNGERIVVGSVQTVTRQARLEALGEFGLIIFDEAHHAPATTYRRPMEYFANAKILGLTATPDRADEKALGQIFEDVPFVFDIEDGIDAGYLVPLRGKEVFNRQIDISGVDVQGGELIAGQLDEAMLKAAEGISQDVLQYCGDKQTIVFTPGVKTAHYIAEKLNELKARADGRIHVAAAVDGETKPDERKRIIKRFRNGELQYLVNCMILTEGFDAPNCEIIVMARPTKSRALFAQQAGRGTRTLPGTVDHLPLTKEASEDRKAAIAASAKPFATIIDMVGNCGKHKLVSLVDILGGKFSDDEVKRAKKKLKANPDADPRDLLKDARAELKALVKKVKSTSRSEVRSFDPFGIMGVKRDTESDMRFGYVPMTLAQRDALEKFGIPASNLSKREATKLIGTAVLRRQKGLATFKQLKALKGFGIDRSNISFERASAAMNYLVEKGFGRRGPVSVDALEAILNHKRQPGED